MPTTEDGPLSPHFTPLSYNGNIRIDDLHTTEVSAAMSEAAQHAPQGPCACWGIQFDIRTVVLITDSPVTIDVPATQAGWLVFMHTSDMRPNE
ncbi:MAG: hypothetical protein MUO76_03660, partial [Anaerolineaceae bacterium]|nr:hypothetical protein [Anaerolineaceae bacterium]